MGVLGVGPRCGTDNWVNTRPMVCDTATVHPRIVRTRALLANALQKVFYFD